MSTNRLLLVGDAHILGRNTRARKDNLPATQYAKFEWIGELAKKKKVSAILFSGDLTDYPHQSYRTVIRYCLWATSVREHGIQLYTVAGQHDLFFHNLKTIQATALGCLLELGGIKLLTQTPKKLGKIWLYGASYKEEIPQKRNFPGYHVLVIHRMLTPKPPFKNAKEGEHYESPSMLYNRKRWFDLILCGDWHGAYYWRSKAGTHIVNPGAVIRKTAGYEDYDRFPTVAIWDAESNEVEDIPIEVAKDSELVLSKEHLEVAIKYSDKVQEFAERLKAGGSSIGPSYIKNLLALIKEMQKEKKVTKQVVERIKEAVDYSMYKDLFNQEVGELW